MYDQFRIKPGSGKRVRIKHSLKPGTIMDRRVNVVNRPGWQDQLYVLFDTEEKPRWVFERLCEFEGK